MNSNSTEIKCESDSDCFTEDILKVCYASNNFDETNNFCDCSNWHGWVGPDCSDLSMTLIYSRVLNIFFILTSVIIISLAIRTLTWYVLKERKKKEKSFRSTVLVM